MDYTYFSYIGGSLLALQLIPQIIKTWYQKNADNLSIIYLLLNISGLGCMGMYGYLINDMSLSLPIGISLINTCILLLLKIYFSYIDNNDTYLD